jgi:predicted esterase YcpF (UPF0227 family)
VKKVLYLHGFASSPGGRKVSALRGILGVRNLELVVPDLNVPSFGSLDFHAMTRLAQSEAKRHEPSVIVGSSLGALVALELGRHGASPPLVLIAPALGFGRRWIEKLSPGDPILFFHHAQEKDLPIHRRFFEQLAEIESDREPPAAPVVVVMGTGDESVPFEHVREHWHRWKRSGRLFPGSRFVEVAGGDHGLVEQAPMIAAEIVRLALEETPV